MSRHRIAPLSITSLRQNISGFQTSFAFRHITGAGEDQEQQEEAKPSSIISKDYSEITKQVWYTIRTRPRWEKTFLSDFPSLNLHDPDCIRHILQHQKNPLLSFRFFLWISSQKDFSPCSASFDPIFKALVRAKAWNLAWDTLRSQKCLPESASLEYYISSLCRVGKIYEAFDGLSDMKRLNFFPTLTIWNALLLGSLSIGRTDLLWDLYGEMLNSGLVGDVATIGYLIRAFCKENKLFEAYELLHEALRNGHVLDVVAFSKLISGYCRERNYGRVSELLHLMIVKNCPPDIFTYQGIIHGLCKNGMCIEGFRIFNNLKKRGYVVDVVTYTTMIDGLSKIGRMDDACKLWHEMCLKRLAPSKYTYNVLIDGYCKQGNLEKAQKLFMEMCYKGYGGNTVVYNTMIGGLCLQGQMDEATHLFGEMREKGIDCDAITYNTLIQGFSKEGKTIEAMSLYHELSDTGLQPTTSTYTPLIQALCKEENLQKATELFNEMMTRDIEPLVCTYDYIITGFCKQGNSTEGMDWLSRMLVSKLRPQAKTFNRLIECLSLKDRLPDAFLVLEAMFEMGYKLEKSACYFLVNGLCKDHLVQARENLEEILQRSECSGSIID